MSQTLILLGLILVLVGLLWRWSGPLRLGRLPGDIVVERTWKRIGALLDCFLPDECQAYLANAGYGST